LPVAVPPVLDAVPPEAVESIRALARDGVEVRAVPAAGDGDRAAALGSTCGAAEGASVAAVARWGV
jgi:hypothetical protein